MRVLVECVEWVVWTAFDALAVALINLPIFALLVWSNARLRRADSRILRVRGAARDPVVPATGDACLLVAGAVRVAPAVALAAAGVETVRGSIGWGMTGIWLIAAIFLANMAGVNGLVAVAVALVVLLGFACVRLREPAIEQCVPNT